MVDWEAFLTALYVAVDDLLGAGGPPVPRPGPAAALEESEVVTPALFAQWGRFPGAAAFSRFAQRRLRPCFPGLPSRSRLNRVLRRHRAAVEAVALGLGRAAAAADPSFEAVDGTGVATCTHKRRGRGWPAGLTDRGRCSRLEWFHGVYLLLRCGPSGAITGFGCGPASTNDRVLAEACFAARAGADPRLPSVGRPVSDCYVADMGFAGRGCEARWAAASGARVVCPPQTGGHPRLAQAAQNLAGRAPPGDRDRDRPAALHLPPRPGAAARPGRPADPPGGGGRPAQLLHRVQPRPRPPRPGDGRPRGLVNGGVPYPTLN